MEKGGKFKFDRPPADCGVDADWYSTFLGRNVKIYEPLWNHNGGSNPTGSTTAVLKRPLLALLAPLSNGPPGRQQRPIAAAAEN